MNIIKLASYLNKKWADYLPQEEETPVEIPSPRRDMPLSIEDPLPEQPSEAITSPGGASQEDRKIDEFLRHGLPKVRTQFGDDYSSIKSNPTVYHSIPNYILEAFGKLWTLVVNTQFSDDPPKITAYKFLSQIFNLVEHGIELKDKTVFPNEIISVIDLAFWKNTGFSEQKYQKDDEGTILSIPRSRAINSLFEFARKLNELLN